MFRVKLSRELGITVAELGARMSHREMVLHMVYDKLRREAEEEAALDARLSRDHAALMRKVGGA